MDKTDLYDISCVFFVMICEIACISVIFVMTNLVFWGIPACDNGRFKCPWLKNGCGK